MIHSIAHRYRDLGSSLSSEDEDVGSALPEGEVEDLQLASFDAGYQAGWEDAMKAQLESSGQAKISAAQHLQDMSFTHREAYLKLSEAMQPLLTQIVHKLLPEVAHQVLGVQILQQLNELMEANAENAIEIVVSQSEGQGLQDALKDVAGVPFDVRVDPIVLPGQAFIRVNKAEREINFKAVLDGISDALDAFYDQTKLEMSDG